VTFTGTRDDVPQLLAAVDVFAVPSRSEGLGVVAIEALAAGLPVLASRVGGLPEIVEDGVCGKLLPPDDVAAWADELVRVAIEPARLAPWREEASKRARAFSIEASVAELERLYGSLPEATTDRRRAA
jgi:glycosyltransferase involved in cell wall biosynthesis